MESVQCTSLVTVVLLFFIFKSLAINMGKGDENLDQDVILKFLEVCCFSVFIKNR